MRSGILVLASALVFVAAANAAEEQIYLNPLMKDVVALQAQALWDVGNKAYDDNGNVDPSRLSADDWDKLHKAGQEMKLAALLMADAPRVLVAPEGVKLQDEGAPGVASVKDIQGFIDASPRDFADHARKLADVSEAFMKAAETHDAQTLGEASTTLDEVCEACHVKYWYPKQ